VPDSSSRYGKFVSQISGSFIDLAVDKIEPAVDRTLETLLDVFDTDRAIFYELDAAGGPPLSIQQAVRPPAPRYVGLPSTLRWYLAELRADRTVALSHAPDDIPEEATAAEREEVARTGLLSIMAVPLHINGRLACVLSTSSFRQYREWTAEDEERLKVVGNVIANALYRKRAEAELKQRLAQIEELKGRLEAENSVLREEVRAAHGFDEIVGRSKSLGRVLASVAQVAPADTTVLLLGETGTGKELLANAIHVRSPRRQNPLVKVNCAAVPPALIESEIFGHEKGAFTGAQTLRIGRFELADRGTIFLDEIGDLSLELQGKLLRVLQEGEFERVGSSRTRKVNVRVIAATNRDLRRAIAEGRFREDLFYRLNVFPITVPPLRERRDDIPLLAWAFIQKKQSEVGRRISSISRSDMERLIAYDWPGNVRELANIIERGLILSDGEALELGTEFGQVPAVESSRTAPHPDLTLRHVERDHIEGVLARCGWRVEGRGQAAEKLNLNPSTLRYRMKILGIRRPG
jgi:transcriptional regulator with GAF, ATPase, and Fis domain